VLKAVAEGLMQSVQTEATALWGMPADPPLPAYAVVGLGGLVLLCAYLRSVVADEVVTSCAGGASFHLSGVVCLAVLQRGDSVDVPSANELTPEQHGFEQAAPPLSSPMPATSAT
jgi:hypothetical protein